MYKCTMGKSGLGMIMPTQKSIFYRKPLAVIFVIALVTLSTTYIVLSNTNILVYEGSMSAYIPKSLAKKIYFVSNNEPFDVSILNELSARNITIIQSQIFDYITANSADISMISFSWLKLQQENVVSEIENFLFSGKMIVFFGSELCDLYSVIDSRVIQEKFTIFPGYIDENNEAQLFLSEDLIAMGITALPKSNENTTRYSSVQFYLIGELNAWDIAVSILDWYNISISEKLEQDTELAGWDRYVGHICWYTTTLKDYAGEPLSRVELHVKYWYEQSDSRPNQWHYFLVRTNHILRPLKSYVAPYKSIVYADCDTVNNPGQIIDDWGPKSGGGPTKTISFNLLSEGPETLVHVEYSFELDTMRWRDLSVPGCGLHKTEHTFFILYYLPYNKTASIETATIFMEDNAKINGNEPLTLTHYAWGDFYVSTMGAGYHISAFVQDSVIVYSGYIYTSSP